MRELLKHLVDGGYLEPISEIEGLENLKYMFFDGEFLILEFYTGERLYSFISLDLISKFRKAGTPTVPQPGDTVYLPDTANCIPLKSIWRGNSKRQAMWLRTSQVFNIRAKLKEYYVQSASK